MPLTVTDEVGSLLFKTCCGINPLRALFTEIILLTCFRNVIISKLILDDKQCSYNGHRVPRMHGFYQCCRAA
jgi:hypothetical protein